MKMSPPGLSIAVLEIKVAPRGINTAGLGMTVSSCGFNTAGQEQIYRHVASSDGNSHAAKPPLCLYNCYESFKETVSRDFRPPFFSKIDGP
jgi:hypothetical protein